LPFAGFTRDAVPAAFGKPLRALRAGDFLIACRKIFERDLVMTSCIGDFRLRWQFPAEEATCLAEEMMDGVEPDQPFDDQIDGDDDVEKPRHDQNENAGNERDDRRDFGGGDDHDLPRRWIDLSAIALDAGGNRQTLNAQSAVRF
jgi:hypothetical protein